MRGKAVLLRMLVLAWCVLALDEHLVDLLDPCIHETLAVDQHLDFLFLSNCKSSVHIEQFVGLFELCFDS